MSAIEQYWPLLALIVWFVYKWWAAKQVVSMLPELRQNGAVFVDVRSPAEFASGNAPGSINIPLNELPSRLVELPKDRDVVVFCASGSRSGMAKMVLKTKGFQKVHNAGTWGNVC
jgi:rhodanese-related sulfurtransferase